MINGQPRDPLAGQSGLTIAISGDELGKTI
jgi:hypothetical protein